MDVDETTDLVQPLNEFYDQESYSPLMRAPAQHHARAEPAKIHNENKSKAEKLFGNCLKRSYDLSKAEAAAFADAREFCNEKYACEDLAQRQLFVKLFYHLTQDKLPPDAIVNAEWVRYGFQTPNPATDLRASGTFGLRCMLVFAQRYAQLVQEMARPESDFCFAITSINCSYFLLKYFHLLDNLDADASKKALALNKKRKEIAGRLEFKSFCQILSEDSNDVVFDLHCVLLKDVYAQWRALKAQNSALTLLQFGLAQERTKEKFTRALSRRAHATF